MIEKVFISWRTEINTSEKLVLKFSQSFCYLGLFVNSLIKQLAS